MPTDPEVRMTKSEVKEVMTQIDGAETAVWQITTGVVVTVVAAFAQALAAVAPDIVQTVLVIVPDFMDGAVGSGLLALILGGSAWLLGRSKKNLKRAVVVAAGLEPEEVLPEGSRAKYY